MRGAIHPLFQYVFVAWCLVKHRGNFTITFTIINMYKMYDALYSVCIQLTDVKKDADIITYPSKTLCAVLHIM
jgi:hypothetical protein